MLKIIIDTDPGIDDALAISYAALHPRIELLGLTSIFGNVATAQATDNACRLLDWLALDIPVIPGCSTPYQAALQPFPDFVHGHNGFGDIPLTPPHHRPQNTTAAQWMIEQCQRQPQQITLVAIGPLTNLALALQLQPQIVHWVKEVVIMGGAYHHPGNVTPQAEANFYSDAEAADKVISAPWPVRLVPLDLTHQVIFTAEQLATLTTLKHPLAQKLIAMTLPYMDFYTQARITGCRGCVLHDPCAVMAALYPHWFSGIRAGLRVQTQGIGRGGLLANPQLFTYGDALWQQMPQQQLLTQCNATQVLDEFLSTLTKGLS